MEKSMMSNNPGATFSLNSRLSKLGLDKKKKEEREEREPKVFGYCRVSTEKQKREGFSIPEQINNIKRQCEIRGLKIDDKDIYKDEAKSGKDMINRPEFTKLRLELQKGDTLIVKDLSRLGRNIRDVLDFANELNVKGCHLIMINDNVDTTTPQGRLYFNMMASFREFERESNNKRTSDVMQNMKAEGAVFGTAPFGYRVVNKILVPDENEQMVIDRITELAYNDETLSISKISKILDQEGFKNRVGKKIGFGVIKGIIERHNLNELLICYKK